ncbi:MAG: GNAT family N-acetyltransferase [Puia sp.]
MRILSPDNLPLLFCKPTRKPESLECIYSRYFSTIQAAISFRSLDLKTDLEMIHHWANQAYAKKYWQLNVPQKKMKDIYESILENPNAHSFIGQINEKPFCQIDLYRLYIDELNNHVDSQINDCGFHLLMLPPRDLRKGWSVTALRAFQDYYFSFSSADELFAEPDIENILANQLALKAGFDFIKSAVLSEKTANIYSISREKFRLLTIKS